MAVIGIDLGTVNSEAAAIIDGKPILIKSAEGRPYFPSVVAFTEDGELLVGEMAKRQAVINPEGTVQYIKRKMGKREKIKLGGKEYTPEQISAFILRKIKRDAEEYLGEKINEAVITVPAYFDDVQRQATKNAGRIAGLKVRRIINEPTAAALAYGLEKKIHSKFAVYDLGGGTFDITIMEVWNSVFEVLATKGDTMLGGIDMDRALVDYLIEKFMQKNGIDLGKDAKVLQRLFEEAEKAKISLSSMKQVIIDIPYVAFKDEKPIHLHEKITREKFEGLIKPIVEKTLKPCKEALEDAKLEQKDISHLIFVGGTTRIPYVRQLVEKFFGKKSAAGVDPMECVAVGAAIQAGILSGELKKEVVLLNVIPLTLGVETLGGIMTPIIERNTTIPIRKSKIFTTAKDFQTSVEIHVVQGERPLAAGNRSLGRFRLIGIPPAPRGVPKIEVTFDVDEDGILHVSAKDLKTGKKQTIDLTNSVKLNEDEIEEMRKEAKKYMEEDSKKKELIEAKINAEALIYGARKLLKEIKGKKVQMLQEAIGELREIMTKNDIKEIKRKSNYLSKILVDIVMEEQKSGIRIKNGKRLL